MTGGAASERRLPSRRAVEIAVAGFTALIGALVVRGALDETIGWGEEGPGSGYVPFYLGLIILASSLGTMAQQIWGARRADVAGAFVSAAGLRGVLAIFVPLVAAAALMPWLGLYVPSFGYIAWIMHAQGGYRWRTAVPVGAAIMAAAFVLFDVWFQVPLAKGPLEALLGLD